MTSDHPYAACGGTPNQYGEDNKFLHSTIDSGGILRSGIPAAIDSIKYKIDQAIKGIGDWTYRNIEKPIRNIYGLP